MASTKEFRKYWYGITQEELSEIFGIPPRTVQGWDSKNCCPVYVFDMMLDILSKLSYRYEEQCENLGVSVTGRGFASFCCEWYNKSL